MAIVKMSSFNLLAFDIERETLLHELQKFNYVHFIDLEQDESLKEIGLENVHVPEKIVAINENLSKVNKGIEILSNYETKESGIKALKEGVETLNFEELEKRALKIDYDDICNQVISLNSNIEALHQEISKIETSIDELKPWVGLNNPIKDMESFKHVEVRMGTIPKKSKEKIEHDLVDLVLTYFEILSEDKENLYILILAYKDEDEILKEVLRNNNFTNAKISFEGEPALEIEKLNERIRSIESEISTYEVELKDMSSMIHDLEIEYEYLTNKKLRLTASENFLSTENINLIRGYIPTDKSEEFTELVKTNLNNIYYLELEEADKDDESVPILLENSEFTSSFESLTAMFALPRYNEIDPTPYLAPFYLVFFGMMGADLGYGLIMLIGSLYVLKKFNLNDSTEKFVRFFFYLSFSVMLWGLVYGSMFGLDLPMNKLINPSEDYMTLLVISVAFGVFHIYFGLGLDAYISIRDGNVKDAIFDVGFWFVTLTGAIVYLISMVITIPVIAKDIAFWIMIAGMLGIIATGGRSSKSIGAKLGGGIYSLYGISGYVGDFVSYSRLMALGMSGGFIAGAINMIAKMLAESGAVGIVFGIIVFIGGQIFNLGLTMLSAYVHSIRLIFVEFFGKFYEGGGKGFNLFINKPKYINLK
ncbi:MAG TPA: V-type ATP synthase subunit I [Tissierellaceae bacterium]|nr:V-type ATP synthase subunit I [Tissierellaceae bacterium]